MEDFKIIDENQKFSKIKTPTVIQMENAECGAAALAIILHYYGAQAPLEKLRKDCGIGREGSKAINIVRAAKLHGLHCESFEVGEVEDCYHIRVPCILYWGFNHFVVLEGLTVNKVYINDPACGRRVLSWEAFGQEFTGVVIGMVPTKSFQKIKKSNLLKTLIFEQLGQFNGFYTFILLSSLFLILPGIALPAFAKIFIDDILIKGNISWLAALILGLMGTAIIRNILTWFQLHAILKYKIKFLSSNSARLIWRILHLPILFFQQRYIGDICYRAGGYQRIGDIVSVKLTMAFINLLLASVYITFIFLFSWQIATIVSVLTFAIYCVYLMTKRKVRDYTFQYLQLSGTLSGIETHTLQSVETIKACNEQDMFFDSWASKHAQTIDMQQKLMFVHQTANVFIKWFVGLANVLILAIGANMIIGGQLSAGSLIAIQTLSMSVFSPIMALFSFGQDIEAIKGDLNRIADISNYPIEQPRSCNVSEESSSNKTNKLDFKGVEYSYGLYDPTILKHIDINVQRGEKVSLVGTSGSGKSTIAKLAVGLLTPTKGKVYLNDLELQGNNKGNLSNSIGYVDQEIFLFEGTLRENLCFWKGGIDDADMLLAIDEVGLFDFFVQKGGLEFFITEGGSNLSQGQKQRVEIARALLYQPDMLILDEATSALDEAIERNLHEKISRKNIGVLTIAHRLSSVQNSDRIYVLDQGKIISVGTHTALLDSCALYNRLYQNE